MTSDFVFLPSGELQVSNLLLFGVLLLTGLVGGHVFRSALKLPRITGFVVAGILLGPAGLNWVSAPMLEDAQVFVDIGLGLVLYELGSRLDLKWFTRDPWLLVTGLAESSLSFALVWGALAWLGAPPVLAALLAATAVSTAPAVVTTIVRDIRAEGMVSERALAFTALNNVLAFLSIAILLPMLHFQHRANWATVVLHPLYLLAGSLLVGLVVAFLCLRLATLLGKNEGAHFILIVSLVVVAVGMATLLKLPVLLTALAFGILTRNLDQARVRIPVNFGRGGELFIIVLFVVAGARLQFAGGYEAAWMSAVFVAARFAGKLIAVLGFAGANTMRRGQAWYLGLTLLPLSGTTLYAMPDVARAYPDIGATVASALVLALALLELVGPIAAQWGLQHAGEAHTEA